MTEQERLGWERVWLMEILFRVAEEHDVLIDDFRFIPMNGREKLIFNLNGHMISFGFPLSKIEDGTEKAFKEQILTSRAKIRQRFRQLMMLHKRAIPPGTRSG